MSIVVLGTVALDTVKTPYGQRKDMLGGSAAHFSMAARLFTGVHLAAAVGKDFPRRYVHLLSSKGINLDSLIRGKGETFRWQGQYRGDLNTALTLDTHLGVLLTFKPTLTSIQRGIPNIFLANVDPDLQLNLLLNMRSPKLVGLDSMNYWIQNKRKPLLRVLKKANIFFANDQEARGLSGENNLLAAARYLASLGPEMVLVKKGEHGVLFYSDNFIFSLPAYPSERVVDPTGAGDTFAGGFMGYLARMQKINPGIIKSAVVYATIAASFNVESFGLARTFRLTGKDLRKRLAEFKKYVSF